MTTKKEANPPPVTTNLKDKDKGSKETPTDLKSSNAQDAKNNSKAKAGILLLSSNMAKIL